MVGEWLLGISPQFVFTNPDSVSKGGSFGQERPAPCMHDLPLRSYLDTCPPLPIQTGQKTGLNLQPHSRYVVPSLLPGMNAVAEATHTPWVTKSQPNVTRQARPENPVEWLAYYLLKNNKMGDELKLGYRLCMAAEFHTFAQMRHVPLDTSNQAWWNHPR